MPSFPFLMRQYHDEWLFRNLIKDDVSDFFAEVFLEMFDILEFCEVSGEGGIEKILDALLEMGKFRHFRKPDIIELIEEISSFFGDTDDHSASDGELESIVERILFRIPDHIPIDRDEPMRSVKVGHFEIVFGKFDDLTVLSDYDMILFISEFVGIPCVPMEHVRIPIDWHINLGAYKID